MVAVSTITSTADAAGDALVQQAPYTTVAPSPVSCAAGILAVPPLTRSVPNARLLGEPRTCAEPHACGQSP